MFSDLMLFKNSLLRTFSSTLIILKNPQIGQFPLKASRLIIAVYRNPRNLTQY